MYGIMCCDVGAYSFNRVGKTNNYNKLKKVQKHANFVRLNARPGIISSPHPWLAKFVDISRL